jgi:hypothetical protein
MRWNSAGTINAMALRARSVADSDAAVRLKCSTERFVPPATIANPSTKRMLPIIDPVIEALTTSCNPARRAMIAMINSAAFPNVAFSNPPIPGPRCSAIHSVALPIHPASGMMAIADAKKI